MPSTEFNATEKVNNGSATATIQAAEADRVHFVRTIVICVTKAAVGGGGLIEIRDGVDGTPFIEYPADAIGAQTFHFGDTGYSLTSGNGIQVATTSALTTQATSRITINGVTR